MLTTDIEFHLLFRLMTLTIVEFEKPHEIYNEINVCINIIIYLCKFFSLLNFFCLNIVLAMCSINFVVICTSENNIE